MMRCTHTYLLTIVLSLGWACSDKVSDKKSDQAQVLYDEVMTIHDEVMPKASDISRLSRQFKAALKTEKDSLKRIGYEDMIAQLTAADDAMMDWMRAFKAPENIDERIKYLEGQRGEIKEVSDLMLKSLSDGMALIKESGINE